MEKDKSERKVTQGPVSSYCHACGHHTPNESQVGSFSSVNQHRASWAFSASDSGYESLDGGKSPASHYRQDDDDRSIHLSLARQHSHSSSVYSTDVPGPALEVLESFPVVEEAEGKDERGPYESWTQSVGDDANRQEELHLSDRLEPPRSRFARLNDLPVVSPRSVVFLEDVYDLGAGIERQETRGKKSKHGRKWGSASSFSLIVLPSKLRRLSRTSVKDP